MGMFEKSRPAANRPCYRASGRIDLLRFLPLLGLVWLGSTMSALLLHLLYRQGWYLVAVAPLLLALAVTGLIYVAVRFGHCRNPWAGALLGALAGVWLYLGCFYLGMVADTDGEALLHPELLPHYVHYRMQHQLLKSSHDLGKEKKREPGLVDIGFNWLFFAMELGFCVVLPALAGRHQSRRAFCEECGRWMETEEAAFPPGTGQQFQAALETGDPAPLGGLQGSAPTLQQAACLAVVELCRGPHRLAGAVPVFLSVKECRQVAGVGKSHLAGSPGKLLAASVGLSRPEIAALRLFFPGLRDQVPEIPSPVVPAPVVVTGALPPACAEIAALPPGEAGQVFNTRNHWLVTLVGFAPLVLGLGGFFALLGGGALLAGAGEANRGPHDVFLGWALLLPGLALGPYLLYRTLRDPGWASRWYLRKLIRRAFAGHRDPLVRPGSPGSMQIEIVPRQNWRIMLQTATDIGFLRLDRESPGLLFEGDQERMRIPAAAIVKTELLSFALGQEANTQYWLAGITIRTPTGLRELPIGPRTAESQMRPGHRRGLAEELLAEVNELRQAAGSTAAALGAAPESAAPPETP